MLAEKQKRIFSLFSMMRLSIRGKAIRVGPRRLFSYSSARLGVIDGGWIGDMSVNEKRSKYECTFDMTRARVCVSAL